MAVPRPIDSEIDTPSISTQSIATMIAIKEPTNEPHIIRKNFFNIALKFEPVVLKHTLFRKGRYSIIQR